MGLVAGMWQTATMIRWLLCIFLTFYPPFAQAKDAAPKAAGAALEAAFRGWLDGVGADTAVLSVFHNGAEVHSTGIGMAPDTPVEIASLSKAITAVCAATLITERIWTAQTTSKSVLGYGPGDITVAQLLTQSAGIGPDQTQALMLLWINDPSPREGLAAKLALQRRDRGGAVGAHLYNNENYAILGAMIAQETGQSVAEACQARALAPADVTATPSRITGGMLAWGGWTMSARDYAAFHYHWFGPEGAIGRHVDGWPHVTVQGPVQYGLGMYQREVQGVFNLWQFGAWCLPGGLEAGSFAVIWRGAWNLVAAYDRCVSFDDMFALDRALASVVYDQP